MKNILLILSLTFYSLAFSQSHAIKTDEATVSFNFLAKKTEGTLTNNTASISINRDALSKSVVMGSANVASLSTENKGRDEHLMSADFFDVEKYPMMLFQSTGLEIKDDQLVAVGSLTIKDVSKEVEFIVTEEDGSLVFNTAIYSSDFGIEVREKREDNKIEVKISVPFSK